jgi:serine/threonine-protein kinase
LNHPNIAAIHGLEETNGTRALVMELVEGEDLSERISRGPIPLEEALPIALQITEALEDAHQRGIIHRDLKPANVRITPEGKVKILDFGLVKALEEEQAPQELSNSPTLTMAATQAGVILGTAAYMSPEQASGQATDKRSDIWSWGVVLFEMLSGRQLFTGDTVSHILASVLKAEPDWTLLPDDAPAPLRRVLRRCLEKNKKHRLHDIADARIEIEETLSTPSGEVLGATATTAPPSTWSGHFRIINLREFCLLPKSLKSADCNRNCNHQKLTAPNSGQFGADENTRTTYSASG